MTSSPAQPTFVASPTLVPDAMHSLDPESPVGDAGPSSAAPASSSARKQRDRGTTDGKEKRSKKDKSSSKDKDKDKDPAQREARRAERERRKAARRSVTSVADSAAGGINDSDSVVPPTPLTPVTPTSLLGGGAGGPQQPRTRTVSGSSAELDADESVPLAVSNSNANRRISRALSAISQQDVMSYGGNAYASGNAHAVQSTLAASNGQATPRTPVFPPTASAAQARRHSQLIAPPSGADDNLPLSVHRQSMILQEENLPIAVAQKRRSMYSDHRTNSVASFADLLSQHSATHGGGLSSATLTGGSGGVAPPMYAAPTPGAFTPRSPSGSTFGQQGAYPMQQFSSGGSQRGSMVLSPSAKPRKGSAQAHLPPPPMPQPQPQLSTFQQITRKLSGRRARGPPTASSSNSGSNHGGTHFADIESQGSNTGFQRKRSLVRRDRAQHHGRTPSGQQAYQGTAHHPHRATLNGMRGNPDGPPGGGGGPNSPVPLPPNISRRPITLPREKDYSRPETACRKAWVVFSKIITFYAVSPLLAACGMPDPHVQQAWREKMALCTIIALLMAALAFLTFAFNAVLCQPSSTRLDSTKIGNGFVIVNGFALDVTNYNHNFQSSANNNFGQFPFWEMYGESQSRQNRDLSFMFQNQYAGLPECVSLFGPQYIRLDEYLFPCTIGAVAEDKGARKFGKYPASYCHKDTALLRSDVSDFTAKGKRRQLFVPWDQLENTQNDYLAFNGQVIDLSIIYRLKKPVNWSNLNGVNFEQVFKRYKNKDATMFMSSNATMSDAGKCLTKIARVGSLDSSTMGCIASDVVLWVSLLVILSLVLSRFFMAIIFRWVLAPKLGRRLTEEEKRGMLLMRNARERDAGLFGGSSVGGGNGNGNGSIGGTRPGSYMSAVISGTPGDRRSVWSQYDSTQQPPAFTSSPTSSPAPGVGFSDTISTLTGAPVPDSPKTNPAFGNETTSSQRSSTSFDIQRSPRMMPLREPDLTKEEVMHTILLVTCYSEDEHGIRTTLDSLAATHYMDTHKLLFVIADGIIMGAGNEKSTPEIIVSMMEKDPTFPEVPKPYSYVAIADGAKRHNMAAVHAGYYNYEGHRVPMVVVVKCGGPEEKDLPKPGNRGKRDSQIVLMSFLQKVMFDERMTPLEYDLFQKIHKVARVTPDVYEMVLMVDADTKVAPDSVERMVACFARDHTVMGLCGETQIENKFGSWVTMIQVFEYYISHHLAKAFESVFGGVTCLPGCFCAYRIKTPKGEHRRHWVPILANPDIVDQYQENVVETLHEKNLFLLGEDRYLTTLMLKTFPKRKMLFVPQATCETTVPDQFSVLLSQRRRWINSTIHNLMELVLVKDLCGTFCISMQFVIAIELFGTLVLPAAICFTIYLVVISFFSDPVPIIPLLLLAAILGLPGLLIVFTTRKWQFLFWMVIYLLSLPVWNFILPTYAFWHFDDFSWGATRVVQGGKDGHDDDDGEFDSSKIIMKRYAEWEQIKQRAIAQALEAAAHQHQQAYRRAAQAQMQQYYGVDNQLVRSNGLEYTA